MGSFLDCRGLSCPAPVLKTKDLIEKNRPDVITVTVDNEAARENVTRFLNSQGFKTLIEAKGSEFQIKGTRVDGVVPTVPETCGVALAQKRIMVVIATDRMGRGDDELGRKLMSGFLKTLKEMGPELWRVVLINNGVKLAVEGSEVLASLKELEDLGVTIHACGTCLIHFGLMDRKRAGEITNMLDIVTSMQVADKVININ